MIKAGHPVDYSDYDGFTPLLPVGRIAAFLPQDISDYLDKIKEHESNQNLPQTIADRAWMKNILQKDYRP